MSKILAKQNAELLCSSHATKSLVGRRSNRFGREKEAAINIAPEKYEMVKKYCKYGVILQVVAFMARGLNNGGRWPAFARLGRRFQASIVRCR